MFDVSPEGANFWFDISNLVLLFGAVLVAAGTFGTIKFAAIKEKFSDERITRSIADSDAAKEGTAKANEHIASLTKQSEQLRKDTAEANARAAELQLELEKIKEPRTLSPELQSEMVRASFDLTVAPAPEPQSFVTQIALVLERSGWKREPYPHPGDVVLQFKDKPPAQITTAFSGVGVEIDSSKRDEWEEALVTLCAELRKSVAKTRCAISSDGTVPPNALHIIVGTKQ